MIYRVMYMQGNGSHCGCCRHETDLERDFDTIEAAEEFCAEIEAVRRRPEMGRDDYDDYDRRVLEILVIDHVRKPSYSEDLVQEKIRQFEQAKADRERAETVEEELDELRNLERVWGEGGDGDESHRERAQKGRERLEDLKAKHAATLRLAEAMEGDDELAKEIVRRVVRDR